MAETSSAGMEPIRTSLLATGWMLLGPVCVPEAPTERLAERVAAVLAREGAHTIAAQDPSRPDRIVAATTFGTRQLSLASGPGTPTLREALDANRDAAVYRALSSSPLESGAFLLHDLNGLGLRAHRATGEAFDMFHAADGPHIAFDGDWEGQGLGQAEYCAAFRRAERAYLDALRVLADVLTTAAESGS